MTRPMTDPRETLARIRKQADAATPGPWETDGTGEVSQHWSRPEPWETVVGTDVACMSYCYGGSAKGAERTEDAAFIAASRTTVPRLADALMAVLNLHTADEDGDCAECSRRAQGRGDQSYPCPTVATVTNALEGDPR